MEVATSHAEAMSAPVKELRDSLVLLALAGSSLGAYLAIAFAAVRVFAAR